MRGWSAGSPVSGWPACSRVRNAEAIEELLAVHRAGGLAPVVTRRYSLDEAGHALADLGAGRITGKAVVVP